MQVEDTLEDFCRRVFQQCEPRPMSAASSSSKPIGLPD
jgi:hypothetical protein